MAKLLDKIVVVDIEATCWEGKLPVGMYNDIIEIGICLLDVETGEISENRGILIKPERSSVSPFCTQLTTITQEMLDADGISFKEALNILRKDFSTSSRAWASFGAYDMKQFQRQCSDLGYPYPFGPSHLNVKTLFALKNKFKHETGMAGALEFYNIPLEGTHHRGVDDAKNIAKIVHRILH
ncbi:MAG TPA: 3'-5' exonuclease [Flavobacterium sp.]|jgi:inhibitor of KinA sporulation pathway (predicted exonuclease)